MSKAWGWFPALNVPAFPKSLKARALPAAELNDFMSSGDATLSNHWEPGTYVVGGWAPQGYLPSLIGLSCLQKQAIICIPKALSSTERAVSLLPGFPWWVSDSAFLQHPRKLKQVFPLTPRETHQSSFLCWFRPSLAPGTLSLIWMRLSHQTAGALHCPL